MKRYTHACAAGMVENEEGRWVKWEDVEQLQAKCTRLEIQANPQAVDRLHELELENVKLREALKLTLIRERDYRVALDKIANNEIYCLETDSEGRDGCDISRMIAREALNQKGETK